MHFKPVWFTICRSVGGAACDDSRWNKLEFYSTRHAVSAIYVYCELGLRNVCIISYETIHSSLMVGLAVYTYTKYTRKVSLSHSVATTCNHEQGLWDSNT